MALKMPSRILKKECAAILEGMKVLCKILFITSIIKIYFGQILSERELHSTFKVKLKIEPQFSYLSG